MALFPRFLHGAISQPRSLQETISTPVNLTRIAPLPNLTAPHFPSSPYTLLHIILLPHIRSLPSVMTMQDRAAKRIGLRRLSRVFHRPTHRLLRRTNRTNSPASSLRHSSGSLNDGRQTPRRSLRRSNVTIVPLPNATPPRPPRSPPPRYSILDPRDRLVVSHPNPSSFPAIVTPSRSGSPVSSTAQSTTPANSRASPSRTLRSKSTTDLRPISNRPRSAPLPNGMSRSFSGRSPLDRIAETREGLLAVPDNTTYAHRLQHQQEHQMRQVVLMPRHSTPALNTQQERQRTPSPRFRNQCISCQRRLHIYEFPGHLPTKQCRHENDTCSYCLHTSIQRVFEETGRYNAQCPQCASRLSESECQRAVLLWQAAKCRWWTLEIIRLARLHSAYVRMRMRLTESFPLRVMWCLRILLLF